MKRMVKNGDLIDVEPDGTITAGGKAINGVEANPTGEATETLEKIKIGDVAYNVGGSENDRELVLVFPYPRTSIASNKKVTIDDENVWNKLNDYYYETIKIYYNDGYPLGVFHLLYNYDYQGNWEKSYRTLEHKVRGSEYNKWYGSLTGFYYEILLNFYTSSGVNILTFSNGETIPSYSMDKSKFDALYKLADKPTGDGTYVLKATVSGGAVTYTWVAE